MKVWGPESGSFSFLKLPYLSVSHSITGPYRIFIRFSMFSCFSKCFAIILCLGRHKSTVISWSVHIQMLFPTVAREIWIADRIMSLPYKIFSVSSFALRRKSKLLCRPKGLCHVSNNTSRHLYPQILSHNWLCKGHLRGT